MEKHKNIVELDGCPYLVHYLADETFEKIEIISINCGGDDFTNIISEEDKDRILEKLT